MAGYLRIDETLDAVTSLELVGELLPKTVEKPHYWKWVVIALHNALQGYMVLALRGSDSFHVLSEKSRKERRKARERKSGPLQPPKLDYFWNLYKNIKKGRAVYDEELRVGRMPGGPEIGPMMKYVGSQPFKPQGTQDKSVRLLHEDRNDFIHFVPINRSIPVALFPPVVKDCLDIIAFLAFESGNVLWHDESLKQKTEELIEQTKQHLDALKEASHTNAQSKR